MVCVASDRAQSWRPLGDLRTGTRYATRRRPGCARCLRWRTKRSLTEAITAITQGAASDQRYRQALDLLKAGKQDEAVPLLVEAAEKNADQAAARFRYAGAIAGLGNPRKARQYYTRALAINPDDGDALYMNISRR